MLNELVLEELRMGKEYDELIKEYESILVRKERELTRLTSVGLSCCSYVVGAEGI